MFDNNCDGAPRFDLSKVSRADISAMFAIKIRGDFFVALREIWDMISPPAVSSLGPYSRLEAAHGGLSVIAA